MQVWIRASLRHSAKRIDACISPLQKSVASCMLHIIVQITFDHDLMLINSNGYDNISVNLSFTYHVYLVQLLAIYSMFYKI